MAFKSHRENQGKSVLFSGYVFPRNLCYREIWSSSFWTSPIQRRIAKQFLLLSCCCVTTLQLYKELLLSLASAPDERIEVFPVLSVLGEPQSVSGWSNRNPVLVILGGAGSRTRLYTESAQELNRICEVLHIQEVLDFGPEIDAFHSLPPSVSWKKMGLCESEMLAGIYQRPERAS